MKNRGRIGSYILERVSNIRIGQRMVIGMMGIITIMVIPIIIVMAEAMIYQTRYNNTLDNLSNISHIIQEAEIQGYRILDECTMGMNVEASGETEKVVRMIDWVSSIRENLGSASEYDENKEKLQIVDNLLQSYAQSYKRGVSKCGENFSMAGDSEFYSMVETAGYIVQNCNDLLSLEMNRSDDIRRSISAHFLRMMVAIIGFVVVVIAVMIVAAYIMTESITYPLGLLMTHISDISDSGLIEGDQGGEA